MSRRFRSPSASPPGDLDLRVHRLSSPPDDGRSFPAPTPPLENDDLLREILVRLPPLPSSLPRASLVCKRWGRLLKDPAFFRRFRAHHRKPPLLGFFDGMCRPIFFTPTLEPPDRIPAARLVGFTSNDEGRGHFCGCRHGFALLLGPGRPEALVWDPITGHQRRVPFPPGFHMWWQGMMVRQAAMLCTAGGYGGADSPFKLVLLRYCYDGILACLYESESGVWGDKISTSTAHKIDLLYHSVLVGNAFCWGVSDGAVLEFDTERQSLRVIEKPAGAQVTRRSGFRVLRTEDDSLGLAISSGRTIQLWERKSSPDRWVLGKTIDLSQLGLLGPMEETLVLPRGFDEDNNLIFLGMDHRIVMIQLRSLEFKMLFHDDSRNIVNIFPYTSFYAAGNVADGEDNGP